jgi:glutamate 5-kinase
MRGSIVVDNAAGRALRRAGGDVSARDVLDCSGGFGADDTVYITFRAVDGGQYLIATGLVTCTESALKQMLGTPSAAVIVRAQDLKLVW